jgi:hypothetical protein
LEEAEKELEAIAAGEDPVTGKKKSNILLIILL